MGWWQIAKPGAFNVVRWTENVVAEDVVKTILKKVRCDSGKVTAAALTMTVSGEH